MLPEAFQFAQSVFNFFQAALARQSPVCQPAARCSVVLLTFRLFFSSSSGVPGRLPGFSPLLFFDGVANFRFIAHPLVGFGSLPSIMARSQRSRCFRRR